MVCMSSYHLLYIQKAYGAHRKGLGTGRGRLASPTPTPAFSNGIQLADKKAYFCHRGSPRRNFGGLMGLRVVVNGIG